LAQRENEARGTPGKRGGKKSMVGLAKKVKNQQRKTFQVIRRKQLKVGKHHMKKENGGKGTKSRHGKAPSPHFRGVAKKTHGKTDSTLYQRTNQTSPGNHRWKPG